MTKKAQFIIPTILIKESSANPMNAVRLLAGGLGRTANKVRAHTGKNWQLSDIDVISNSKGIGNLRGNLRALTEDARAIQNSAKFSKERDLLAQQIRRMRGAGLQGSWGKGSKDTITRFTKNKNTGLSSLDKADSMPLAQRNSSISQNTGAQQVNQSGPSMRQAKGRVVEPVSQRATPQVSGSSPAPASASAPSKAVDEFTDLPGDMAYKPGVLSRVLGSTGGRIGLPIATGAAGYGFGSSSGYDEGFGQGSLSAQQMAAIQAMQAQQQARQMYDNQGFLDRLMGNNPF